MKKLFTIALAAVAFAGFVGRAQARDHCGSHSHHSHCGSFHSHGCSSFGLSLGVPLFYNRPYYGYGYSSYYPYAYSRPSYAYSYYPTTRSYSYSPAADVQMALARRGYYDGDIDGVIGPMSRSAIRRYQAYHGLPVTGAIDYPLVRSLALR